LKGRILALNWPFTMGKLAKVILKSSSSSPFNGHSNTYIVSECTFLNFLLYLMFSTTYTVLLSPGPEERLANLKQHFNKNIIYIANARQSSVQIERKISNI
jgi:hypothetical protein